MNKLIYDSRENGNTTGRVTSYRLPRESLSFSIHESARVCRLEILYHPEHRLHAVGYFDLGSRASHIYTNITDVHYNS